MTEPPPPDPGDRDTLTAVLAGLADEGWTGNVTVTEDGTVRCPACRNEADPASIQIDSLRRMEGTSDPDDMLAAIAVTCGQCDEKGVMVVHYGPGASPEEADVLRALDDAQPADDHS